VKPSFALVEPFNENEAHFTFDGPFEGETITWDARLIALGRLAGRDTPRANGPLTSYIEIGDLSTRGRTITVGLDVPVIDEPTILRTVVMIRQYRRLRRGHHKFGT